MLKSVLFRNEKIFNQTDEENLLDQLTDNVIIFCESAEIKNLIALDIMGVSRTESCRYETDTGLPPTVGVLSASLLTTRLLIDKKQIVVITTEAPFAFLAKNEKDVWFASNKNGKIELFPLRMYEDRKDYWPDRNALYRGIEAGKFGNVCAEARELLLKTKYKKK